MATGDAYISPSGWGDDVTLGDVSALWGLRIDGDPIGGVSDDPDLMHMIPELLGAAPTDLQKKKKKKKGEEEEEYRYSKYCISLAALRSYFHRRRITPETRDEQTVLRYVRAFVMDLCGSVMFVDSSGDAVPIMFLSLLRDIQRPSKWNWGGAVLAHLYRGLCHACLATNKQIAGPLLLLQQWSWSHIPVCRPVPPAQHGLWTGDDPERRPGYGAIWAPPHTYEDTGRGRTVGISYVRGQLQMLHEASITWYPYRLFYDRGLLCQLTLDQRHLSFYRGPCVCFWIVEYHYPDRVPRQFGLDAYVPDFPELGEQQTTQLHSTKHNKPKVDWMTRFWEHYQRAASPGDHLWTPPPAPDAPTPAGPWRLRYLVWYQRWGMPTVYLQGDYGDALRRRLTGDGSRTYLPFGPIHTRSILTGIRGVAHSLVCMARKSWRAIGCQMLQHSAPIVEDSGWDGRLVGMLHDAGEDINWREIKAPPLDPEQPGDPIYAAEMPPPPADDDSGWAIHQWVLNNNAWNAYYNEHGVPVQLTEDEAAAAAAAASFSLDDLAPDEGGWEPASSHRPQYMEPRQHDGEASGSGAQTADGFAAAIFGTPLRPRILLLGRPIRGCCVHRRGSVGSMHYTWGRTHGRARPYTMTCRWMRFTRGVRRRRGSTVHLIGWTSPDLALVVAVRVLYFF
ncbi:Serine/threonine-protein [Carex littledalei]|uniref:Serine/threonine-protein n=1 Tax=Carex littledalei TaxID=544730 RepID=A0A833UY40_9POAL|nr:Serine/threonine-protein [Carex littledalei]